MNKQVVGGLKKCNWNNTPLHLLKRGRHYDYYRKCGKIHRR